VSEKRVNIKITASTSDFEKAIKNAQKQIEKLAETIDDIGKGKFGDKLEKQVDKVADAAKKAQNELEDTKDTLDDINKSKTNKLTKQLDKTADSVEDLNDELDDTEDVLDDLKKAKINKLEKQFDSARKVVDKLDDKLGDVVDSLKDLDGIDIDDIRKSFENIREANDDLKKNLENLANEFKDLDSQDLNRLENELDRIDTSIRDMRDGVKDAASDLDKHFRDATSEVRDFDDAMDDIDYDSIDKIKDDVKDLDKFLEKSLGDMGDKSLNIETNVKTKGSDKGSLVSDMITEFAGAEIVGKRVSSAIQEMKEGLDKTIESMKDMSGLTPQEQVKKFQDLADEMIKVQDAMDGYQTRLDEITTQEIDWREEKIEKTTEYIEELDKELGELSEKYDDLSKSQDKHQKSIDEYNGTLSETRKEIESYYSSLEDIKKEEDSYNEMSQGIDDYRKSLGSLQDDLDAVNKKTREMVQLTKDMDLRQKFFDEDGNEVDNPWFDSYASSEEFDTEKIRTAFMELNKEIARFAKGATDSFEEAEKKYREFLNILDEDAADAGMVGYMEMDDDNGWKELAQFQKEKIDFIKQYANEIRQLNQNKQEQADIDKKLIDLAQQEENVQKSLADARERQKNLQTGDAANQYKKDTEAVKELGEEIEETVKKRDKLMEDKSGAEKGIKKLKEEVIDLRGEATILTDEMQELQDSLDKGNKIASDQADKINEQLKAYERLSKRVKDYLSDEEKSILLREKVAKSFKGVSNAMEQVYAGSSKYNNADLINKTLEDAAKYVKELNVVSTKNLQNDLDRLGDILEDKTDKVKRFKDLMNEYGSKDSGLAHWLEEESRVFKDYANEIPVVVEAMDTLRKAWGDVSVGGEDNLKLRARAELLDDFADNLKKNIVKIKNAYSELESLDDIREKATDEEKIIIDDYKAWEKNKEALEDYNKAITEYMSTIKDMGGKVDDKFLDSFGKFDFDKFVEDFDKMGASTVVLSKRLNAVKSALLENLKTEKEESRASLENAKANEQQARAEVEAAKAAKKAAKSDEDKAKASKELADARERLTKAEKELKDAQEKSKNIDTERIENAKKLVKQYNEQAEAARKLGIAIEDISKADISSFDKSLGSLLDGGGVFGDDSPFSLGDIKEDIKAIFSDMGTFDFGSVFDGLKGIVSNLFSKIPMELQAAVGIAAGIGIALKKSAEMGIEHFGKGVGTIKSALSTVVDVARDIGQELVSAFENITGMDLDFSSMIELPIDFESQMAKVGAITGTTDTSAFAELEEEARRLGSTTRYSATEVAEAMEYMGMAGWDNTQVLAGLESVLDLATVSGMDLGDASDFVTDALTALNMEAGQAAEMVDMLAAVSTNSNTSVAQMQKAFTNCAPVAGTLGINMRDLSIALGLMADKGVKGAKAGTALKNLMANLSDPTEEQLAYIRKFNLEGAQQAITTGDLVGGLKQMQQALSGLEPKQKNAIITTIAGKEALSGIAALLNTTESDLAELEAAMDSCSGSADEMATNFDDTVKGALLGLSSAMQETLLQVFDKAEGGIKTVTKQLTEFFNILNGFSTGGNGSGLADALTYLEGVSQGWGQAIATGLTNAIGAIDDFVNSESFDNLLQVGTNIINGIANGIREAADNGTLGSAISTAIGKLATWFSENLETVVEVGREIIDAISNGISENGDAIGECIKQVMEMQTEIDKAVAKEKWKLIGENLVTFITEGLWSKISVFFSGLTGFLQSGITEAFGFISEWMTTGVASLIFDPITWLGEKIGELLRDKIIEKVQEAFNIDISGWDIWNWGDKKKKDSGKKSSTTKKSSTSSSSKGTGKKAVDTINSELSSGKVKTDQTAASIGQGISDNITQKLETMDAAALKQLNQEMINLGATVKSVANGMAVSFKTIQDASRTSFMGFTNIVRNQMINCTNIIRNQAINWYNIIANQTANARNIFTTKFISMASVARTQMVNVTNIVRNQAISWYNIIANQAKNARDEFTRQMISMSKVAATQMGKVSSSIRGAMTNASSSAGAIGLNVNRTLSVNYAGLSADALYAANNSSTSSIGGNTGALAYGASYAMSTGGNNSAGGSIGSNLTLEIPVCIDGKVAGKAMAKYVDGEIKTMNKRENRKRGAK
jgi:TP901 family phage tail tape measure protein